MKHKLIKIILSAGFIWTAGMILTPDARGADTVVYAIKIGTQTLGTLDLNTGVFTQIAAQAISEYQLGEYGGVLYGASTVLFQINPTTGVSTPAPIPFSNGGNNFGALNGFGSTTAGLFAIGAGAGGDFLYSINLTTGNPTLIGSTGINAGGGTGFLSASVDSSSLYWEVQNGCTDALYSINTSTGAATFIGSANACFPSTTGNPYSLVFTGGTLWANFYSDGFGTINTSTGAQTLVSTAPAGSSNAYFGMAPFPLASATPTFVGSMPHVAAQDGWSTTFTYVNKGTTAASAVTNLFTPTGTALTLPINLPQTSSSETASSITQTIAPRASFVMQATGPLTAPYMEGSAQLAATGTVDGYAIFHFDPTEQEAVVPMETRTASSYLLAFDNTGGVLTGVAITNVSTAAASIPVIIRDDQGNLLSSTFLPLAANGHTSFVLSDPATGFPVTANRRGTVEFDAPSGSQISALGIRYTAGTTTTIPALANVGTTGGLMAHVAVGMGWQTTFVLVNTGSSAAQANLAFFDKNGNPLSLPLSFPQGGTPSLASTLSQSIGANGSLWVQSTAPLGAAYQEGSAQLTTNGNIGGFVIFRFNLNGQEAVVPLESRNANGYLIAYDNTGGTVTGIAISALSPLAVQIPVTLRDDQGNVLSGGGFELLGANGHDSFGLAKNFPQTANIRGTIEFDTPAGAQISVLGIRTPPPLTFTTLPALTK